MRCDSCAESIHRPPYLKVEVHTSDPRDRQAALFFCDAVCVVGFEHFPVNRPTLRPRTT